jgi:pyridoxine kinase
MAKVLAISSQVASGHVGLSAIVPALMARGHVVIALPTVLLANHPGRQPTSGTRIEPAVLGEMLATLASNGRLDGVNAIMTGYLPSAAHVAVAAEAVARCKALCADTIYLCDPVIGDDPKGIYIDEAAAAAVRDTLVPMADVITPNRFELNWLAGVEVLDVASAVTAARRLGRPTTVATSIPFETDRLATLAISATAVDQVVVARRDPAPSGTGDLLAALFLAGWLDRRSSQAEALAAAVQDVDRVLAQSAGAEEMRLAGVL